MKRLTLDSFMSVFRQLEVNWHLSIKRGFASLAEPGKEKQKIVVIMDLVGYPGKARVLLDPMKHCSPLNFSVS